MRAALAVVPVILAGTGLTVLYRLGRGYGAVPAERSAALPGDDVIPAPTWSAPMPRRSTLRRNGCGPGCSRSAGTAAAGTPPAGSTSCCSPTTGPAPTNSSRTTSTWPSVTSFPTGHRKPVAVSPLYDLQPERYLLLQSTTHLPRSWRDRGIAALDWTWVFLLYPVDGGARTRFVFRWRGRTHPWWLRLLCHAVIVPADFLMSRDMLRGLRQRAERTDERILATARAVGTPPSG